MCQDKKREVKLKKHLASSALTTATRGRKQHSLHYHECIFFFPFHFPSKSSHPEARTWRCRHNHQRREINGTPNVLRITSATTRFQRQRSWQPGVEPAALSRYTISGRGLNLARRQRLRSAEYAFHLWRLSVVPAYCIVRGGHLPWRFTPGALGGRGLLPFKK